MRFRHRPNAQYGQIKAVRWVNGHCAIGPLDDPKDDGSRSESAMQPGWFPHIIQVFDSSEEVNLSDLVKVREERRLHPVAIRAGLDLWIMDTDGTFYLVEPGQWLVRHVRQHRAYFEVLSHHAFCETYETIPLRVLP